MLRPAPLKSVKSYTEYDDAIDLLEVAIGGMAHRKGCEDGKGLRLSRQMKGFDLYCAPYSYAKNLLAGTVESSGPVFAWLWRRKLRDTFETTISKLT